MFESSRKLPRIPQPGPQALPAGAAIHQHISLAAFAVSVALGCGPAAKFTVDLTMQA